MNRYFQLPKVGGDNESGQLLQSLIFGEIIISIFKASNWSKEVAFTFADY